MPDWKIAWLICGICRQWRERPLHQVNEDRTIKKIICGYFIELWYAYRLWKLDFSKPAVLEFVTLTFFQYVCWKTLLQNINQNRLWLKILVHKKSFWWICRTNTFHTIRFLQNEKDISGVKSNMHSKKIFTFAFYIIFNVVFWYISNGT